MCVRVCMCMLPRSFKIQPLVRVFRLPRASLAAYKSQIAKLALTEIVSSQLGLIIYVYAHLHKGSIL